MVRRRREWTQAKYERYIKEGRGRGSGKDYKPWLTIQDFPSKGRSSRTPGWKTNRVHHFFSDHEKRLFYLFEWSDIVTDIREQFPLDNLDLAMSIATDIGIKYPIDTQSGTPKVLTSDFMLTVNRNGKQMQIARTVKQSTELEKKRVNEKLEIERQYYLARGIDWGIITEKEISRLLAENVEWVHSAYRLEANSEMDTSQLHELSTILKSKLQEEDATINKITNALDEEMNVNYGTSLYVFKHLIAKKQLIVNLVKIKLSACPSTKVIEKIIF
ncbi:MULTISPECIES: TnsA endonuclease C-terminal domain-containing protein [unclassified Nostoc]|uniref:TnsA endonuclease C-terminal domain-containing protein n=1 Tax=unclassified Nostoc TaxID=2593658 RepID=UPI0025AB5386|nr:MULTISPECIES: TnsA endonuclease C-terminal domain-containing protein [unclassified Nostoc]MDM9581939.1 TnsA endonuclease N-terminal domain-containing protein [Nostoc sp. GT001]MDZ7945394.1 TnsA endonuclease C-terminal domain-containing protein [Nostoc sp. EfeVER01]MDZ7993395.1 TnsA endonuclease C-terminal domain-containing protein [Nostoc sp. EspVER01]